ncbi:MAG: methylglyoxal synthase [Bacteroidales bacterium]|nr:methylglyoxal synthase [Bacteroidales bacterium]
MKPALLEFFRDREKWLLGVNLVATGRTAEYLEQHNMKVKHMSPGKSGGYNEITKMVSKGEVDILIFLIDPDVKQNHHKDIVELIEACNVFNIPWAMNHASADLLIIGHIRKEAAEEARRNYMS